MFTFTHHEADNLNYSSTDLLKSGKSNCSKTSPPLSPSSLLLGRAKEEEIFLMYKDPGNYKNNFKGRMLFWMVSITVLVDLNLNEPLIIIIIIFHISCLGINVTCCL